MEEILSRLGLELTTRAGEEVNIAVEEVGTGVGYVAWSSRTSRVRFRGRGSAGEDDSGSNAGSREVVGRFEREEGEASVFERVVEGDMSCCHRPQLPRSAIAGVQLKARPRRGMARSIDRNRS